MEHDVQRRRHSNEITPAAALLDLKQHTVAIGIHLLRVKVESVKPATDVTNHARYVVSSAYVAAARRSRDVPSVRTTGGGTKRPATAPAKLRIRLDVFATVRASIQDRRRRNLGSYFRRRRYTDRLRSRPPRCLQRRASFEIFQRRIYPRSDFRQQIITPLKTQQQLAKLGRIPPFSNRFFKFDIEEVLFLRRHRSRRINSFLQRAEVRNGNRRR